VLFNFYNDQLFRIIVDYDRHRTEGMTETPDTPVAVWGNPEYSVTLLRVAYPETFRLVLTLTRLENLARGAAVEAVRMDV
jgi:hypothetical protein